MWSVLRLLPCVMAGLDTVPITPHTLCDGGTQCLDTSITHYVSAQRPRLAALYEKPSPSFHYLLDEGRLQLSSALSLPTSPSRHLPQPPTTITTTTASRTDGRAETASNKDKGKKGTQKTASEKGMARHQRVDRLCFFLIPCPSSRSLTLERRPLSKTCASQQRQEPFYLPQITQKLCTSSSSPPHP
ncbi:hypothetical protein L249_3987 [Ophiocordyceps polyrhachis-furcata BCC 54312]|uniref:Secreted protein n=1 Tax=Ophiocordyceps polyrhachis-furcata BCC 54312 TaxID=1330021 RepID=A0A367L5D5_9HYPO|nr:hypothetical protein L249_3987 [Ophiocordyceps polyrhachis-furcata BCC 54312]